MNEATIFLTDRWPEFCPSCGHHRGPLLNAFMVGDWIRGASIACDCGTMAQYVPRDVLLGTARNARGDLAQYATGTL